MDKGILGGRSGALGSCNGILHGCLLQADRATQVALKQQVCGQMGIAEAIARPLYEPSCIDVSVVVVVVVVVVAIHVYKCMCG
jgi:hypothetical protein